MRKYLYERQVGTKITYLTEFQDLVGQQHDLLVQQSRLHEAEAAVEALTQTVPRRKRSIAARSSMISRKPNKGRRASPRT